MRPSGSRSFSSPPVPWSKTNVTPVALSPGIWLYTKSDISILSRRRNSLEFEPRQYAFDGRAARLEPRRQFQPSAKLFHTLIERESRRVGCYLEQHPSGLAKIDGVKI